MLRQFINFLMPSSEVVGHENGNVVTGIDDITIDKLYGVMLLDVGAHVVEQLSR